MSKQTPELTWIGVESQRNSLIEALEQQLRQQEQTLFTIEWELQ